MERENIETQRNKQKRSNEIKSWFFENQKKKVIKFYPDSKKKKRRAQIKRIKNQRSVTSDTTEIKRIKRGDCE